MSITIPKPLIPILTKPMTPPWVLALVIATQLVISQVATDTKNENKPGCTINVQRVHVSTHSREYRNFYEAKLKIGTHCTSPQRMTKLNAFIVRINADKTSSSVAAFTNVVGIPDPKYPQDSLIENLTVPCLNTDYAQYFGVASGEVELRNGTKVPVEGKSKIRGDYCGISAK